MDIGLNSNVTPKQFKVPPLLKSRAERRRAEGGRRRGFVMQTEKPSVEHRTGKAGERPHMASEVRTCPGASDHHGPQAAEEFVRDLKPFAQRSALGIAGPRHFKRGLSRHGRVEREATAEPITSTEQAA